MKLNLICFLIVVFAIASLVYIFETTDFTGAFSKPWHLSPSIHEDSLSQEYLNRYRIYNHKPLLSHAFDSSQTNVFILVDAWGVPIQESTLKKEFDYFKKIPHVFALHQRLGNRNKHAERVEFRGGPKNKIYLFGGDSTEYNRPSLVKDIGFEKTLFCQKCGDGAMLSKIDSLLVNDSLKFITWTTQSSRGGDKDSLQKSLSQIVDFAMLHPNVKFVVQGTHRPILVSPEIRNSYMSHWVPVAILNITE
jgi:hypothetical protein